MEKEALIGVKGMTENHQDTREVQTSTKGMNKGMNGMRSPGRKGLDPEQAQGMTPLHWAVLSVENERVGKLLENGADVNATTEFGYTPLHMASLSCNEEAVAMLIEKGADVNAIDDTGTTPLHIAARCGSVSSVQLLMNNGADTSAEDFLGLTPARWASENVAPLLKKPEEKQSNS